ncbi:WS/DGAT/MGAT family O-acyltransferase [Gordonia sp. NPDC003424]
MRALTSLDTFFLAGEDGRTVTNVSSLAILDKYGPDGEQLTRKKLQDLIGERLHLLPPLRWRLAQVPFNVGHPYWIDGEVDLDFHVRELALVAPGDLRALETQVARLSEHPMDRSHPLWEVYLIHGLQGDRVAVLTKLHHAAVDGMSGAEVMNILLDGSPEGREIAPAPRYRPEQQPGQLGMLARGLAALPGQQLNLAGAAGRTLTNLDHVAVLRSIPGIRPVGRAVRGATRFYRGGGNAPDAPSATAPRLRINGRISPHRQLALVSLPLDDVKALKEHFHTTVNDVVVALCAGALRRWLIDLGELPDEPLVGMVPISVRTKKEFGTFGNKVSSMVAELPTDEPNPIVRLRRCRESLRDAKGSMDAVPASLMRDANDLVPPILFGRAMSMVTALASSEALAPAANLVISNVPGSRLPLYCAGHMVREHYPVSAISDSLALNVTVFSYRDRLEIGLVGDRMLVENLQGLAAAFPDELKLLNEAQATTSIEGVVR